MGRPISFVCFFFVRCHIWGCFHHQFIWWDNHWLFIKFHFIECACKMGWQRAEWARGKNGQAKMSVQPNRNKHHLNRIKKWPFMKFIKFNIQTLTNRQSMGISIWMISQTKITLVPEILLPLNAHKNTLIFKSSF